MVTLACEVNVDSGPAIVPIYQACSTLSTNDNGLRAAIQYHRRRARSKAVSDSKVAW